MAHRQRVFLPIIDPSSLQAVKQLARTIMHRVDGPDARKDDLAPFLRADFGAVAVQVGREVSPPEFGRVGEEALCK